MRSIKYNRNHQISVSIWDFFFLRKKKKSKWSNIISFVVILNLKDEVDCKICIYVVATKAQVNMGKKKKPRAELFDPNTRRLMKEDELLDEGRVPTISNFHSGFIFRSTSSFTLWLALRKNGQNQPVKCRFRTSIFKSTVHNCLNTPSPPKKYFRHLTSVMLSR